MNNEPVAWMQIHYKDKMCVTKLSPVKTWEDDIPLYTHPAKTLTDEEIEEVFLLNCNLINETFAYMDFARGILRKAQEK
jgi:hypothetical protein